MAKKVAIIYSGAKHRGGMETYLNNLFKYADDKKVELTLFSLGEWELCERVESLKYKVTKFLGRRIRVKTIYEIVRELKKDKYDLVVSQGVVANAYSRAASLFSGVPSLVTIHSAFDLDYPNPTVRLMYFLSDRISRWRTKKYITVSEFLKDRLVKSGIKEGKIEVIYNGVPLDVIPTVAEGSKEISRQARNDNDVVIGSIGRLHKVKGYENLIKAMGMIEDKKVHLVVWGEGEERDNLKQLIKKYKLENRVSLPGQTDSIERALANFDLYVQPSLSEGFGLTVVEAMMAGLPVIVAPNGSLPELVEDGKTGIVLKDNSPTVIAEAIEKLISDRLAAQKLGENAALEAKRRFDVKKWAEKTIETYLKAIH